MITQLQNADYRVVAGRQVPETVVLCKYVVQSITTNRIVALDLLFQIADGQVKPNDVLWHTYSYTVYFVSTVFLT